jgi:hypothetical protein
MQKKKQGLGSLSLDSQVSLVVYTMKTSLVDSEGTWILTEMSDTPKEIRCIVTNATTS